MKNYFIFPFILFSPMLMGFTDFFFKQDAVSQEKEFVQRVQSETKPKSALDKMDLDLSFSYKPYSLDTAVGDPFVVKNFVSTDDGTALHETDDSCTRSNNCGDGPPAPHLPYYLEKFALDDLQMVGSIDQKSKARYAIIRTPDGDVFRAAPGEYIGANNGLIQKVLPDKIVIQEKVRTGRSWQNRTQEIKLSR